MNWNEHFIADFEAGTLTWKQRALHHFPDERAWKSWNTKYAGKMAGYVNPTGYSKVRLFDRRHLVHRVIFEMANGPIPAGMQVDHIDQSIRNNSRNNLRLATNTENGRNRGLPSNNTSGVKGVCYHKCSRKWRVTIDQKYIGTFATLPDAIAARKDAESKYHREFAVLTTLKAAP